MNRKRIALITSLALLTSNGFNNYESLKNSFAGNAKAAQTKRKTKKREKYPDINKELDIVSMEQYDSKILYMNVTLNNFYVKDLARDDQGRYILLLVPIKTSSQYFLTITHSNKIIQKNQQITIKGFLNGKVKINTALISDGLNKAYLNKTAVSLMVNQISIKN